MYSLEGTDSRKYAPFQKLTKNKTVEILLTSVSIGCLMELENY